MMPKEIERRRRKRLAAMLITLALVTATSLASCDDPPPKPPSERGVLIKQLKEKYGNVIRQGVKGENIGESVRSMEALMKEWDPVGSPQNELRAVLGEPSQATKSEMLYRFDSGLGGWEWRYEIEENTVRRMEKRSLD